MARAWRYLRLKRYIASASVLQEPRSLPSSRITHDRSSVLLYRWDSLEHRARCEYEIAIVGGRLVPKFRSLSERHLPDLGEELARTETFGVAEFSDAADALACAIAILGGAPDASLAILAGVASDSQGVIRDDTRVELGVFLVPPGIIVVPRALADFLRHHSPLFSEALVRHDVPHRPGIIYCRLRPGSKYRRPPHSSIDIEPPARARATGLVLAGGGSRGAYQVGVLGGAQGYGSLIR